MKRLLDHAVEGVSALAMVALTVIVFVQVFNRFILKTPLAWSEDVAMLLYQWVVFLGTALGVQRLRHFSIELLVRHLSPGARRAVDLLTPIAMAVVALVMIVQGWAILGINRNRIYATMDLSYVWAFLPIPLAGVLILIYVVQLEVRRLRGGPPTEGGHGR